MNKRMDFIDKVAQLTLPESRKFLLTIYSHYVMSDFECGGKQSKVFHALYLENKKSFMDIRRDLFISASTLYRYRNKFNKLAEAFAGERLKMIVGYRFHGRK